MQAEMQYIVVLALIVIGALVFFRIAPSDPARWHVAPEVTRDAILDTGARRVVPGGDLAALDSVIRATPRTRVLAGSVGEGMITYVTRSLVFGFPDYTTVLKEGTDLKIHARSRYGKSDLGVNAARVDDWLLALPATQG